MLCVVQFLECLPSSLRHICLYQSSQLLLARQKPHLIQYEVTCAWVLKQDEIRRLTP